MSHMPTVQLTQSSSCPGPQPHQTPTKAPSSRRTGSAPGPGADSWFLSPGSLTHFPGLSQGPGRIRGLERVSLRVTRARLAGENGWDHSQTKIYGLDHNNERKKEKRDACSAMPRDQDCCPITKNVALDSAN